MEKRNNVYFLVWNLLKKLLNNQITIRTTAMRLSPSVLHILLWRSYYNIQHVIILNSNLVHHYSNIKYWSHTLFPLHMSGRICGPKTNTKFAAREVLGMRDTNNTLRYAIADSTSTKSGPCEQVYYKKKYWEEAPKEELPPQKVYLWLLFLIFEFWKVCIVFLVAMQATLRPHYYFTPTLFGLGSCLLVYEVRKVCIIFWVAMVAVKFNMHQGDFWTG